ncbi:MAG: gamma-glutamyltransferase [Deltaproteobacteria bacterium]
MLVTLRTVGLAAFFGILTTAAAPPKGPLVPHREKPKVAAQIPPAPVARGKKGVVVSAHADASRAGVEILDRGGNALDAAVATAYALAVVEPFSAGVGGGGFLLYFDAKTKKVTVVDYREVAPRAADRDMYLVNGEVDPKLSLDGILAVAVPGMVPGLAAAQKKLGRLKLSKVLDPAIRLAADGFLVSPRFHEASVYRLDTLRADAEATRVFLKDGQPYPVGERLVQKDLAKALRAVKRNGPRVFTHGWVAKAIAKTSKDKGGRLVLDDLKSFRTRFREPLVGTFRDHTVYTMPPPSSGGTHLLQMLSMLDIDRERRESRTSVDVRHAQIEIMRRAYADRAVFMGDPAFVDIPLKGLLARDYAERRYATIDWKKATPSKAVSAGKPNGVEAPKVTSTPRESNDTTHLTVIDKWGNVVALTQTVNYGFGSGVVVPGTGVLLNDEMDDFSAKPGVPNVFGLVGGEANAIQPGKIPLSSMTPTIVVKDGAVRLAAGSPGGSTIITTVLQVILNVLDRDMTVAEAVAAPRIHMQWLPDVTRFEPGALTDAERAELEKRGFALKPRAGWGNATAIEVLPDGTRIGAADPRGDGGGDAQ